MHLTENSRVTLDTSFSQHEVTCSKSTIEILEPGVKQDHVKHIKPCSTAFATDFEHAIVC